ncbi:uncharacterized protein SPSK_00241 [Sporothrix schenckii 1099-18]|nr:uncharacterized protein SPSK_00241 [Sporothrix schenckii 1099-18]KJR83927.1 hypothetical protein SPSK_00241 [Sporothrix schenckii 1099-18]
MDRDRNNGRRFDDGEVTRYGAGESWRPSARERSPWRERSPIRDRERIRDWDGRDSRDRRASPPPSSDSYIPGRSPRRPRSRSIDQYRISERARESERWRPVERSRSRPRSPGMRHIGNGNDIRRSPPRRLSPRYVSPRRGGDDRGRILDRDRGRSPPRRDAPPLRDMRRSPPRFRPRSRSSERPLGDDRMGGPVRRTSPTRDFGIFAGQPLSAIGSRSGSRPSSPRRSPVGRQRNDRSRQASQTPRSPHMGGLAGGGPNAPTGSSYSVGGGRDGYFDSPMSHSQFATPAVRSPPSGPASLRHPQSGPNQSRKMAPSPGPSTPLAGRPAQGHGRGEVSPLSASGPPTGPRGYGQGRSGGAGAERSTGNSGNSGIGPGGPNGPFTPRQGGRGNGPWVLSAGSGRRMSSAGPSPTTGGPSGGGGGGGGIPTGPRAGPGGPPGSSANGPERPSGRRSRGGSPSLGGGSRPFNPPTGPASQQQGSQQQSSGAAMNGDRNNYHRDLRDRDRERDRDRSGRGSLAMSSSTQSVAQQAMANMPVLIPGGKLDPLLHMGILPEIVPHYQRLREEEERLRSELDVKQDRLRKQLRSWDKMEREARAFELKSELSEKSLKTIAGESMGGAAF